MAAEKGAWRNRKWSKSGRLSLLFTLTWSLNDAGATDQPNNARRRRGRMLWLGARLLPWSSSLWSLLLLLLWLLLLSFAGLQTTTDSHDDDYCDGGERYHDHGRDQRGDRLARRSPAAPHRICRTPPGL